MNHLPITNAGHVRRLPEGNHDSTSWKAANEWFGGVYSKPLLAFVRSKLSRANVPPGLQHNAEDYLQDFFAEEWKTFKVCRGWDPSKRFHPYLLAAVNNFVNTKLSADSPPGTTEEYEPYRQPLEAYLRDRLVQLEAEQSGARQVNVPERLMLVEDYVREFLEHYASRHPRPPQPKKKAVQADDAHAAGDSPEEVSEQEIILSRLQVECWQYFVDQGMRRRKRTGKEQLDDRADGWEPVGRAISPTLAYGRTWAIELLTEALAVWRANCQDEEGRKRWMLFRMRVLEPFYAQKRQPKSDDDDDDDIPPYADIYADCGYDTERQAANAYGRAKVQLRKCIEETLRQRARQSGLGAGNDGGDGDESLERRVQDELNEFQAILAEDQFWHHSSHGEGTRSPGRLDGRVLRRYVDRKLNAAAGSLRHSDPSDSSAPEEALDLAQFNMSVIAEALATEGESQRELASQWRTLLARPWPELLTSAPLAARLGTLAQAAGLSADSRLKDLLRQAQAPAEMIRALREAVHERRQAASEPLSDRVLNGCERACMAAALAYHGEKITSKEDARLRKDLDWLAQRPWIDDATRELAAQAAARLGRQ
jgi:hypothetical protein